MNLKCYVAILVPTFSFIDRLLPAENNNLGLLRFSKASIHAQWVDWRLFTAHGVLNDIQVCYDGLLPCPVCSPASRHEPEHEYSKVTLSLLLTTAPSNSLPTHVVAQQALHILFTGMLKRFSC